MLAYFGRYYFSLRLTFDTSVFNIVYFTLKVDELMWSTKKFIHWLQENGESNAWENIIFPQICQLCTATIEMIGNELKQASTTSDFEMLGYDFMIGRLGKYFFYFFFFFFFFLFFFFCLIHISASTSTLSLSLSISTPLQSPHKSPHCIFFFFLPLFLYQRSTSER